MNDPVARIFESRKFKQIIRSTRINSISAEFPTIQITAEVGSIDWNYALLCASILSSATTERAQNTTLRIAVSCLESDETEQAHKHAAAALLARVGNQRSVELAEEREMIGTQAWTKLPPLLRLEAIRTRLRLSIPLSSGSDLAVNSFQEDLWNSAEQHDWLSISAPTSAGKSRIVREWFLECIRKSDRYTAVYLAPTRALVEEISAEFRREVDSDTGIVVMPWDPNLDSNHKRVLVVTQERLHLIQSSHRPFQANLLFVDEAQGLGAPERGILLQQVIDRAVEDNPNLQVMFASPLSANPELLLADKPSEARSDAILSEAVTVNQNLLRIENVKGAPAKRTVSLVHEGQLWPVGEFQLQQRATKVPMRLAYVAHAMGGTNGGNIVYVNGADDAEKVAINISNLVDPQESDEEIIHLQELIRTAVHPKYSLADTLQSRVAFHYGNMPLLIRSEIERLFGNGKIQFLVCTSTLLEGVNLPCKTIFMRNPQKGRGRPLSEPDFWNLAGRAGRWGKEFQGNIVCIDTDKDDLWLNLPLVRRRSELKLATRQGMHDAAPLLAYIRSNYPVDSSVAATENLFSYLATRYASGIEIIDLLDQVSSSSDRSELERAVKQSIDNAEFPRDLVTRHAGISPVAMQRLLEHFRGSQSNPHDLALPLPEEPDSRQRYQSAFVHLGTVMTSAFGSPPTSGGPDRRKWQLANLVVNWMNGMPLARLIEQRSNEKTPIARTIRDVMADIETIARFQAPKFLSCYSDILAVYAAERGIHDIGHGQDITMLLELGVSRPSEVVLMSLGLSRTATIALSGYITVDNWTSSVAIEWLRNQNFEGFDIPVLIQRELADAIRPLIVE